MPPSHRDAPVDNLGKSGLMGYTAHSLGFLPPAFGQTLSKPGALLNR